MSLLAGLGGGGGATRVPKSRARRGGHWWLLGPGLIYLLVFFLVPVGALLMTSLYVPVLGGAMGDFSPAFHWQNYSYAITTYWRHLVRSFVFAGIATLGALTAGYPMAYAIAVRARRRKVLQNLLLVLVIAPFFISFILRTMAWKQILADEGPVVAALHWAHILPPDGRLTATAFAVVCGLAYNFLPFMVLPIYANLERLDPAMLEAGADLYATPFTTFRKVTFPLSMPGVVAGTLLVFIPAAGDYINASLLGNSSDTTMIGQVINTQFTTLYNYPTSASLSAILMIVIMIMVTTYVRRSGTEELL